ncbi:MAG: hypothetical protein NTX73_07205 [Rhodobacterales bacterium]|nr:hypothetical protein [Rhodobacterales bacterium]
MTILLGKPSRKARMHQPSSSDAPGRAFAAMHRKFRVLTLTGAAIAALAACQAPVEVAAPPTDQTIRASADAGPGTNPISAERARAVFSALCVDQRGSPAGTEAAAAADGFVKNTTYGTYYHPRDNLSVKLINGDCSMVFASRAPVGELEAALTSLTAGAPPVRFSPSSLPSEDPYYNVSIPAQ